MHQSQLTDQRQALNVEDLPATSRKHEKVERYEAAKQLQMMYSRARFLHNAQWLKIWSWARRGLAKKVSMGEDAARGGGGGGGGGGWSANLYGDQHGL